MHIRWLLLLLLVSAAFAQPPASVANFIYYQNGTLEINAAYSLGIVLKEDGTAHMLFLCYATDPRTAGGWINRPVSDGKWSYRKIDNDNAQLFITGIIIGFPLGGTLTFKSSNNGSAFEGGLLANFQLIEPQSRPPLVNCSNRSFIPNGGSTSTGFVVTGNLPRFVLVRAVGPGLAPFSVPNGLPNPKLTITGNRRTVAQNDDWQSTGEGTVQQTSAFVGAFPLSSGSKDAAIVVPLGPGAYVAEVTSEVAADSGQVLTEVYMLP